MTAAEVEQMDQASILLAQAKGIIELVLTASNQIKGGVTVGAQPECEIAHSLYAAVDQITRAKALVDNEPVALLKVAS